MSRTGDSGRFLFSPSIYMGLLLAWRGYWIRVTDPEVQIAAACGDDVNQFDLAEAQGWPIDLGPNEHGRPKYFPVALFRGEPDIRHLLGCDAPPDGVPAWSTYCAHARIAERQCWLTVQMIPVRRLPAAEYLQLRCRCATSETQKAGRSPTSFAVRWTIRPTRECAREFSLGSRGQGKPESQILIASLDS